MLKTIKFRNFKSLRDFNISLKQINVFVGPNNAGKSTILDAFRVLSVALNVGRRRNPSVLSIGRENPSGWEIPETLLPISLSNIHTDYDPSDTWIEFTLDSGKKVRLTFYENARCIMTIPETPKLGGLSQFRRVFPDILNSFPTLGPLEEEEDVLSDDYVERWKNSRRTHRLFRNIWYRQESVFPTFRHLVESTWPGMSIEPPILHGYAPPRLAMFCREGRIDREIYWAGFGFQVWLQLLTHLIMSELATTLIVDEPEIYLHPDLQHKIFSLLRASGKQIVLATHSAEIVNEAEHDEVVLINRSHRSGRRVEDIEGLQEALFSIGSGQNIHLARLSKGKKILFLEGQDYRLLKRFAAKCSLRALADEVSITVVPIGGFTQKDKISNAAWTFQKVLRANISIAAVLDRDYRCDEEIRELMQTVRQAVPDFHVLGAKEIENYLLVPTAMARATQERAREGGAQGLDEGGVRCLLDKITKMSKSHVSGQIIAHRMNYFAGSSKLDFPHFRRRGIESGRLGLTSKW